MIYYTGLLIYILILKFFTSFSKRKEQSRICFFILTCLGVILFQGFRSFDVGTDLLSYIPAYNEIGNNDFFELEYKNFEIGYVFLNHFLNLLGVSERGFLLVIAAIVQIPIFYTIYRYSELPLISILWYFAFGNFLMTFSGLRQAIAMAMCFSAYKMIKQKKFFRYCIILLLAALFHKSALFCFLLYPLYYLKLNNSWLFLSLIIIVVIFIFREPIFTIISSWYYEESLEMVKTDAYTTLLIYLIIYILAYLKPIQDRDYIGLRNILFLLIVVFEFASVHNYVTRIAYPLTLYMTLFIPKLIKSFNITPKYIYYGICGLICIVCFFYFLNRSSLNTLPFSFG